MSNRDEWKPNNKQAQLLQVPFSIKEAGYLGGAGSGKSDLLLMFPIVHRLHEHPKFKQVFMRRTFPELRNEIVPRSREIYTRFGARFNRTEMCWTFPRSDQYGSGFTNDGALIFLGHCEDENDVHKYDSMEINLFTPDEITSFTEYIYLYIALTRVRSSIEGLPSIVRFAGMPGGIGHTWVKKRFIDPCKEGGTIIEGKGGIKRIFIRATLADNPHIDPTYAQSLDGLPSEAERKAKKFGDFDAFLGQVFSEFRDKKYPDEPDNALHVIPAFEIPEWWPKFVIGDWGFAAMTWIGYFAVSPNRRLYLYREQAWRKVKIEEWAPYVKQYIDEENPRMVKFCKSAGQDRGQEHTIQQQISDALGISIELTTNNPGSRIAGKALLHEYLRWTPKHQPPMVGQIFSEEWAMHILRNRGLSEYKSYLQSFTPIEVENNLPKYQIFDCCPLAIEAIKACVYAKSKDNIPAEDVAEFDGDDPYDGQRYACDEADRYFDECSEEFKLIEQRELLEFQLQVNQDFTAFYRNARRIESESEMPAPVRRYSHAR